MSDQEQIENIIKLTSEQKSMSEKLNDIKLAVDNGFKDIKEEFKAFREDIEKSKANKWVETVMRIFLVSFGLGVLSFIGYYFWELVRAIEKA